jgi:flagellar biosynthetic protein FliQ
MLDSDDILHISSEAVFLFMKISAPTLLIALTVGLTISILQALTQIQEATISFVPKLFAVLLSIIFLFPLIGNGLYNFSEHIASLIAGID